MLGQINFTDIFSPDMLSFNMFDRISFENIFISMFVAFVVGLFIFFVYKKTFRGVIYSHNFNVTLILMCMITTLIIMTISTNIVLSLGMVGALSIVRFRTAIKDPLDVIFMFWSVGIGITTGAGIYILSIVGSLFIGLVMYIMTRNRSREQTFLLVVHYDEDATDHVKVQLSKIKHSIKSKIVRSDEIELTVELKIKGDNTAFMRQIQMVNGVKDVALINYNGDYAA
ncbi:hypothetical protein KP77_32370 [Jeotgalibacillus alimentarius]|uniref:DUF4956 domain-containing protein n=2 Tax=Jeotgalibacillus TaxID=157226 RepID=A0A0C2VGB1_9BACL|nr:MULTISPECIES: DUF4956 domain-containing protein [Jeotgalibacillus]KIL43531.1 hypothetical protein KP77_32370 [Jeotgalibacillus alimentarius]MBM7579209.1 putative membrane protein YhiD involved in acid resistance [Jeotgalibacillus terrae]